MFKKFAFLLVSTCSRYVSVFETRSGPGRMPQASSNRSLLIRTLFLWVFRYISLEIAKNSLIYSNLTQTLYLNKYIWYPTWHFLFHYAYMFTISLFKAIAKPKIRNEIFLMIKLSIMIFSRCHFLSTNLPTDRNSFSFHVFHIASSVKEYGL